ncbi:MAG: MetQ/NlpA family ABC transporter substrate-binding protein, partial [Gemella haemolysans]|nr:MetQ/NlpA family ABC transporter substrate-binding protein [Gemella haemolysans]
SYNVTVKDIKDNPKHLKFTEVGLLNLSDAYADKDLVFNYPTYIAKLNLTPMKDGLLMEDKADFTYAGVLAAREDNKDDAKIQAVKKALTSQKVKDFLQKNFEGKATAAF